MLEDKHNSLLIPVTGATISTSDPSVACTVSGVRGGISTSELESSTSMAVSCGTVVESFSLGLLKLANISLRDR